MPSRPDTSNYRALFLHATPLMDVRAPLEFARGSFPEARNAPLMNDEERHRVGLCYQQQGQEQAIRLGHQLVCGDLKTARLAAWTRFTRQHPQGYLYCFRGGLRSHLVQQWLRESGVDYPLVTGGYKAMRRYLIDTLEALTAQADFVLLSGRTGTGKTRVLTRLPNPVDLEHLANHRGSSFGRQITPQPSQIDFENRLAVALLQATHRHGLTVYLEDESRLVGRCALPEPLRARMAHAPLLVLERPLAERVRIIREDYIEQMLAGYCTRDGAAGWHSFREYLLGALERIQRRLGGERYRRLRHEMEEALSAHQQHGDLSGHERWIARLLRDYYDPMYDYQLQQKSGRILLRGDPDTIIAGTSTIAQPF
ncbi:tRNA 2-selenouridine(34) synthase MnmH [Marinobacter sp. X15-166B]|uniref:tRNA 2-selenouridine(34) synthase MnmH n=1 Tax=Marinobacter sp. X15-166B TaxID=1897620 RepID=UPI00085C5043|nr:tRNA 2-selenouridine(34) synthase MnmH [Marinobacter sp. X15-166B]OEY65777.1 tRNA 2-selenouridine(34) synthase MnmH [Marinobacter sp. X15-166B]